MSLLCLIKGCRPETSSCRCRRCGRTMHGWRQVEKHELASELFGRTRKGLMRYHFIFRIKDRCASCGIEREQTCLEWVDH